MLRILAFFLGMVHAAIATSPLLAGGQVELHSSDGRALRGVIDARTDDERVWVRRGDASAGIVLAASFAWDEVVAAALDGEAIEMEALRAEWSELASPGPRTLYHSAVGPDDGSALTEAVSLPRPSQLPYGRRRGTRVR